MIRLIEEKIDNSDIFNKLESIALSYGCKCEIQERDDNDTGIFVKITKVDYNDPITVVFEGGSFVMKVINRIIEDVDEFKKYIDINLKLINELNEVMEDYVNNEVMRDYVTNRI